MTPMDKVGKLVAQVMLFYAQWAKQQGINYNILAVIHTLAVQGKSTQKHIGEEWHLSKQTVFSVCQQLKAQGYIDFVQDSMDKREKTVFLTAQGLAYAQPIIEKMRFMEQTVLNQFGQNESMHLINELTRLSALFNQTLE